MVLTAPQRFLSIAYVRVAATGTVECDGAKMYLLSPSAHNVKKTAVGLKMDIYTGSFLLEVILASVQNLSVFTQALHIGIYTDYFIPGSVCLAVTTTQHDAYNFSHCRPC